MKHQGVESMQRIEEIAAAVTQRLFVELEASGRHVHVTCAQAEVLFGHPLTPKRPLSQPGQFLACERVSVIGPKGEFQDVAVLGPERKEAQVEVSLTDARALGLAVPVRPSGSTAGSPGAVLVGSCGRVTLERGVIAAQRHIHLTKEAALRFGVCDGQLVRLRTMTARPVTFEQVLVRVSGDFAPFAHLDYDEANACGYQKGDLGRILL